jgi:hypothetical protein
MQLLFMHKNTTNLAPTLWIYTIAIKIALRILIYRAFDAVILSMLQSAANLLMNMIAGGNHTLIYTKRAEGSPSTLRILVRWGFFVTAFLRMTRNLTAR